MRKILFMLLCAVSAVVVAREVNPNDALNVASKFLNVPEQGVTLASASQRVAGRGMEVATPDYYVYNKQGGGWVIVAADDRINPILAYSETGSFKQDNLPIGFKSWMENISLVIDSVRQTNSAQSEDVDKMWRAVKSTRSTVSEEKVIETACWDQGYPYNMYCPAVSSESQRAATGCLATATGIIMHYYKWPVHGNGVIGGYTTATLKTYIPAYSIDDHYYDWDAMPMTDYESSTSRWSDDAKHNVATLLHDIGVAYKMNYTSYYGSSAAPSPSVLIGMGYSEKLQLLRRSSFTLDKWFAMIKAEIDADRLILYGGFDQDKGGHAFVCDGYNTDGSMLHINWGWSGGMNGFYTLDLGIPNRYQFDTNQNAVMPITPADNPISSFDPDMDICPIIHYYDFGMSPIGLYFKRGSQVRFEIGYFENTSIDAVSIDLKVSLMDKDGSEKSTIVPASTCLFEPNQGKLYTYSTPSFVLEVQPELTDYYALLRMRSDSTWVPFEWNKQLFPGRDYMVCSVTPYPIIIWPQDCRVGDEIALKLTYGQIPIKSVQWYLNGVEYNDNTLRLKEGKTELRAVVSLYDDTEHEIVKEINL